MKSIFVFSLFVFGFSSSALAVKRPPQFVNLAFDGSKNTRMWKETTDFAKNTGIKFTYFVSGVYFLSDAERHLYRAPYNLNGVSGRSDLGFGGSKQSIGSRNAWVLKAINNGHEIASHANGHFDGSGWGYQTWMNEFNSFSNIISSSASAYGGVNARNWERYFRGGSITGFRAPLLGHSPGMFQALSQQGFNYDTSRIKKANYWPLKISGIWNFPLAGLRTNRTNIATASMDYNMYFGHSKGKKGASANYAYWEEDVYETYIKYFLNNYLGNRAPVDIGHHFSKWNGGIYWNAMKRFAKAVCDLPEVICGTYQDQVSFLNSKSSKEIAAYQNGQFEKMNTGRVKLPLIPQRASSRSVILSDAEINELNMKLCPKEAHIEEDDLSEVEGDETGVWL